eukprot:tig00000850_g4803.t1
MTLEARARQAAELEALQSFHSEAFEPGAGFDACKEMIALASASGDEALAASVPQFEFTVRVRIEGEAGAPEAEARLGVSLPSAYPADGASRPVLSLSCPRFGRDGERRALDALHAQLDSLVGEGECLFQLIGWLAENGGRFLAAPGAPRPPPPSPAPAPTKVQLGRCLVRFHHIYSTEKRRFILEWAGDLGVTGVSRPGKPGLVYAEGDPGDVRDYVAKLRNLPWQKMSVVGDVREPVRIQEGESPKAALARGRRFRGMKEVTSDGLFGLVPLFTEAGLESMFRDAIRVPGEGRGPAAGGGARDRSGSEGEGEEEGGVGM